MNTPEQFHIDKGVCNRRLFFKTIFFILLLFSSHPIHAQPGISEFYYAESRFHQYFFDFSDLAMSVGAVTGLFGGLRVYNNWQMGKPHIDSQVAGWFFSCLFLSLLGIVLSALYGVH